jgi:hypothetical protein
VSHDLEAHLVVRKRDEKPYPWTWTLDILGGPGIHQTKEVGHPTSHGSSRNARAWANLLGVTIVRIIIKT